MAASIVWRLLDGFFLFAVFIIQSVILSLFTVYQTADAELPHNYVNPILQKLLWLTGDFICLLGFALSCYVGFRHLSSTNPTKPEVEANGEQCGNGIEVIEPVDETKKTNGSGNAADVENGMKGKKAADEDLNSNYSLLGYLTSDKLPLTYISWFLYAALLTMKITVICSGWMEKYENKLEKERDDGYLSMEPDTLLLGIGLSGIIFSLLVEAYHNAGKEDLKRKSYINHISYGVALEVLDTASLLSFLLPSSEKITRANETGAFHQFPAAVMTITIITLAGINLFLPCITLYKLTANKFGETYHARLELIYNSLHFLLVSIPFFIVRVFLWSIHGHKDILFLIKNAYSIVGYFRWTFSDFMKVLEESKETKSVTSLNNENRGSSRNRRKEENDEDATNANAGNSIEMKTLMK